jgi:hypothetical protein
VNDYQARILAHTVLADPIQLQREAPAAIDELVAGHSDEQLRRRPKPDKWSVVEILAHMAEDELVSTWRYRQMVENSGCELSAFDQDQWAHLGSYHSWTLEDAFALFRLLREGNLRMFSRLTGDQWQSWGVHKERGRTTVRDLARHMAGHDRNHIDQINEILR